MRCADGAGECRIPRMTGQIYGYETVKEVPTELRSVVKLLVDQAIMFPILIYLGEGGDVLMVDNGGYESTPNKYTSCIRVNRGSS